MFSSIYCLLNPLLHIAGFPGRGSFRLCFGGLFISSLFGFHGFSNRFLQTQFGLIRLLNKTVRKLIRFLKTAFCLEIKPGWNIRRHIDCGIDMMGYVITAKGRIRIRPRVFIRARRAYMHAAAGDLRPKITRRVSAYYGFFKAAKIRQLRKPKPARDAAAEFVSIHAIQFRASMLTSKEDREVLLCAA